MNRIALCNRDAFIRRFEPILETLEPWKDCDTAELKGNSIDNKN